MKAFLKTKTIAIFFLVTLFSLSSFSQESEGNRFNITMSPIGFVVGLYNLGVDVAITEKMSLGISAQFMDYDNDNVSVDAKGANLKAAYFFNQVFQDSWYVSGDVGTLSVDGEDSGTAETASVSGITTSVKLGYMWRWTNFNIQLGLGVNNLSLDIDSSTTGDLRDRLEDIDGINPALDFIIGFAF